MSVAIFDIRWHLVQVPVVGAGFEQQNGAVGVFGEAAGDDRAGRACADYDVVVVHGFLLGDKHGWTGWVRLVPEIDEHTISFFTEIIEIILTYAPNYTKSVWFYGIPRRQCNQFRSVGNAVFV